jgi:hypothetical protein
MKIARLFLYSTGAILLLTALAKLISSFGHESIFQTRDPLIALPFRNLFLIASGIELAVAVICLFSKRISLAAGFVAWLATSLGAYRLGLWKIGWHKPCNCLGSLTDAIHISPQTADAAMKIILAYLLVGSYATLFWHWRQTRKT